MQKIALPDNDYQILRLTDAFYDAYPNPPCIEILKKKKRAYNCLLFQTHYDYFICVPFRSEIAHKYAFRFKNSIRSRKHKSGLDFTKMVIIKNLEYVDTIDAIIDRDEFKETMQNLDYIKLHALSFLEDYIHHHKKTKLLNEEEYQRRYNYSPLKYFHTELNIF